MTQVNKTSRRKFISTTVKSGLAFGVGITAVAPALQSFSTAENIPLQGAITTGFDQKPLPYKYDALEDVIDAMTMEIHYTKHAAGYAKNLQEAAKAENVDITKPVENLIAKISQYTVKMRNNAGGHFNHELFWQNMRPKQEDNVPNAELLERIVKDFSSFEYFKKQFSDAAKTRFGSGWAWLYVGKNKKLMIGSTPNQDNPLMDISEIKGTPLLGLDVWEHAYYLKYQNKRADYIENWFKVINWDNVSQRLHSI